MTRNEQQRDPSSSFWHIDRKIPAALIVTIVLQTLAMAFWVGSLSNRVDTIERAIATRVNDGDRITRLEVKLENQTAILQEIKQILDRMTRPLSR